MRSQGGDVFLLIAKRIELFIIEGVEGVINKFIISWLRDAVGWLGVKIKDVCITREDLRKYCPNDENKLEALLGCELGGDSEPHKRCFYECACYKRKHTLLSYTDTDACVTGGKKPSACPRMTRRRGTRPSSIRTARPVWSNSSTTLSATALKAFRERCIQTLAASTFSHCTPRVRPTMMAAFKQVDVEKTTSAIPFNYDAQRICDQTLIDSMTLDQVRSMASQPNTVAKLTRAFLFEVDFILYLPFHTRFLSGRRGRRAVRHLLARHNVETARCRVGLERRAPATAAGQGRRVLRSGGGRPGGHGESTRTAARILACADLRGVAELWKQRRKGAKWRRTRLWPSIVRHCTHSNIRFPSSHLS